MFNAWLQIFKRDLLIAFRRRSEIIHPLIFFVMVISLFPLAIGDDKVLLQKIAPAIIWVTALLATMLSLDNLFRSDFEDGSLEEIVSNASYPVWSPDSSKIAYSDIRSGGKAIHQVDVREPQNIQTIIEADFPVDHSYAWSSDGGYFAYTVLNPNTGMDIMMLEQPGTGEPQALFDSNFEECCPTFSPDGKWLAYISDLTGRPEVHITSFPELGESHQISSNGAREPVWSHRDNIIYFWEDRQMMMVDLGNAEDLNNLEPAGLIEGIFVSSNSTWRSRYDIKPDGSGYVLLRRGAEETGITELMQVTDIFGLFSR